jgi:hypothetical protein
MAGFGIAVRSCMHGWTLPVMGCLVGMLCIPLVLACEEMFVFRGDAAACGWFFCMLLAANSFWLSVLVD